MRTVLLLFVLLLFALPSFAQSPLLTSGRNFSFGIIEGAENIDGVTGKGITLTILGTENGTGTISSPCGYTASFSFSAMTPTIITLPDSLIHLNDNGKTKKGLIVSTSQPVSLVLHDILPGAGDATQILPDGSLDTSYYCPSWGIWDDTKESNHSEIIVTASVNNTTVTIKPSVMTLVGDTAQKPITIILNAGECYILKCDTSHGGAQAGLSGTTISASKPVSVIVGTTCAYVPGLPVQSCNELMDEIAGRSHWGETFYLSALGNDVDGPNTIKALLTSDSAFSYSENGAYGISTGRTTIASTEALRITTSRPVYVQQLSVGSVLSTRGMSDPTMVTVPDSTFWSDSVMWNTLELPDAKHYVSLVYPEWRQHEIELDGRSLDSLDPPQLFINGSALRSFVIEVKPGVHTVTSPVPIFCIATGWAPADAYSFLPAAFSTLHQASVRANPVGDLRIAVTPNPSSDHVSIYTSATRETEVDISVLNILGVEVAHLFHGYLEGDRSFDWNPRFGGIYECVIRGGSHKTVVPIIIQK